MENGLETRSQQRDISVITAEIKNLCEEARLTVLLYSAEIGRRLVEAKTVLPHGEWGAWLKNEVHFSQRTAENHMKIFEAYGSPQVSLFGAELKSKTFANLSYSAALKLLAVPDDEREEFVKSNDIENKSVREIDQLLKELEEAKAEAEQEARRADEQDTELDRLRAELDAAREAANARMVEADKISNEYAEVKSKLEKSKEAEKKARAKLKELRDNPEIPQEKIDALRTDIERKVTENTAAEIENRLADIKKKLAAAEEAEIKARREAENAAGRIAELEKRIKTADPAVAEFRALFDQFQDLSGKLLDSLAGIKDTDMARRFRTALAAAARSLSDD